MNFKKLNNITGWFVFAVALFTYTATLEPTVSLWDCGEYISTAYKLEVGHPPGAPMFNMLGRMFSAFVPQNQVAYMVNFMSGLCSAFTILFMFWSVTYLVKKMASRGGKALSDGDLIAILGSGAIGALAYTFSDSFWFSAVEGEVYAMSSFFTALVVWGLYKWEEKADEPGADRWLIFLFFMVGISIGVHLLNLLAIPAMVYVYYFRRYGNVSTKGFLLVGLIGMFILGFVQGIVIPGMVSIPAWFEKLFVNSFGMPFSSGATFFYIILSLAVLYGLYYSHKKVKPFLNTMLLCFTVVVIGYSCFFMIPIRSNANTPIDENNPENQISMLSYLLREQYGSWPLLYGPYWNSAPDLTDQNDYTVDGNPIYMRGFAVKRDGELVQGFRTEKEAKEYVAQKKLGGVDIVEEYFIGDDRKDIDLKYNPDHMTVFPRMFSREPRHIDGYKRWSGYDPLNGGEAFTNPFNGQPEVLPTFGNNLTYFFNYQLGWMYWRYFMWNFVGRQNDEQAITDQPVDGNWISGIGFIDSEHVGNQEKLPTSLKANKAYNRFFFLPLILGLIGMLYHLWKAPKDWFIVMLLFVFTGIMIIVYLNSKPYEPRERDYAYAGSFYAFAFWIGIGVYALYDAVRSLTFSKLTRPFYIAGGLVLFKFLVESGSEGSHTGTYSLLFILAVGFGLISLMMYLGKKLNDSKKTAIIAILLTLPVPAIMAMEGWDDHDRSNRYTALDFAYNYLQSCEKNAIIFTHGDNDTFPLWYAQEVEGIRRDVRIVNLSLLGTDWYVDQMLRKAYESDPVPFTAPEYMYRQGGLLDYIELDAPKEAKVMDLKEAMAFVMNDDNARVKRGETKGAFLPTRTFDLKVDRSLIQKYKVVPESDMSKVVADINFTIPKSSIYKNDLFILDLLAHNDWKRPVYFAGAADSKTYLGLQDYFSMEGLSYKFVPIKTPGGNNNTGFGRMDVDKMYDNLMKNYKWGNLDKKGVHADYYVRRTMTNNYRLLFLNLGQELSQRGRTAEVNIERANMQIESWEDTIKTGKVNEEIFAKMIEKTRGDITRWEKEKKEAYEKVKKLMHRCFEVMPEDNVPFDRIVPSMIPLILQCGDKEFGMKIASRVLKLESENLEYYFSLQPRFAVGISESASVSYRIMGLLQQTAAEFEVKELGDAVNAKMAMVNSQLQTFLMNLREYDPQVMNEFLQSSGLGQILQQQMQQQQMQQQMQQMQNSGMGQPALMPGH